MREVTAAPALPFWGPRAAEAPNPMAFDASARGGGRASAGTAKPPAAPARPVETPGVGAPNRAVAGSSEVVSSRKRLLAAQQQLDAMGAVSPAVVEALRPSVDDAERRYRDAVRSDLAAV